MNSIFRGDDTGAFEQSWLQINVDIPLTWIVSKAELKIGDLPVMIFEYPEFPLMINLTSAQTLQLKDKNTCYLALYDENNLKQTLEGSYTFSTRRQVV